LLAAYEARAAAQRAEPRRLHRRGPLSAARFTITRITDVFLPANVDEDLRRPQRLARVRPQAPFLARSNLTEKET